MKILTFAFWCLALAAQPTAVIIDTDAGSDDLMAIAYLLARADVHVEAITVVNGLAHVGPGATNILRLLALSKHREIPVYVGSETPLQKTADFPDAWRKISDELPGVNLPMPRRRPEQMKASEWLASRLADTTKPVTVLALGPLTNLAKAVPHIAAVSRLVIMGGALRVPGNLGDGGLFKTENKQAEWNIFADPKAAQIVFGSGAKIELVPLDATSRVPIGMAFLRQFRDEAHTPLARFVAQVLESDRESIEGGYFQAWDPLAAVSVTDPGVVMKVPAAIRVEADGGTAEVTGNPNANVALDANPREFNRIFRQAFHNK